MADIKRLQEQKYDMGRFGCYRYIRRVTRTHIHVELTTIIQRIIHVLTTAFFWAILGHCG